jgi:hypothetical protein
LQIGKLNPIPFREAKLIPATMFCDGFLPGTFYCLIFEESVYYNRKSTTFKPGPRPNNVEIMEGNKKRALSPWISIWTKPRATIQQIVDTNPQKFVVRLTCIEGFASYLEHARFLRHLGDKYDWPVIFAQAAIIGPIAGLIALYFVSAMISWTGTWIGGKAPSRNIRAAMAWSGVPTICVLILWIPQLTLFGQELFTTKIPRIHASPSLWLMFLGFGVIDIIICIWEGVIYLKCLGQVQGFSIWKALGNAALAALVIIVPVALIAIIIGPATLMLTFKP